MSERQAGNGHEHERVVVLGCGMGGLAAAAALSRHFEDVVIIERDAIPDRPEPRRGVPQDEQLHNVLSCAQINLEGLMPGFLAGLRAAGAGEAQVASETHVHELGIRMPERDVELKLMSAWRPVIEYVARQRLQAEGRIAMEGLTRATGLRISRTRGLTGVVVDTAGGERTIAASLVVDATGSASLAHHWLESHGRQIAPVQQAKVNQWYASTVFERPGDYRGRNDFWLSFPAPSHTRGGLVSPIGDNLWYVSLSGHSTDQPPRTIEEVKVYAASLDDESVIARLIEDAQPRSKPNLFRKTTATMRRYDLINQPLPGFLPLGDSIASLNPLFGQGMSVASWQATELNSLLATYQQGTINLAELTSQYLAKATGAAQTAWELGKVVDQSVSGNEKPEKSQLRYEALARFIEEDPEIHKLYVSIWHLIKPATALQAPAIRNRLDVLTEELARSKS